MTTVLIVVMKSRAIINALFPFDNESYEIPKLH